MELISMTEFVLEQAKELKLDENTFGNRVVAYANFLKQPLTLGMFVPCDEDGSVLEKPYEGMFEIEANTKAKGWAYLENDKMHGVQRYYDKTKYLEAVKQYQKAKDRVLFIHSYTNLSEIEDEIIQEFTLNDWVYLIDLSRIPEAKLQLTPTALKQIGL